VDKADSDKEENCDGGKNNTVGVIINIGA